MIPEYMEPKGLAPDAEPVADYAKQHRYRDDAIRGSNKLLGAMLRALPPPPPVKRRPPNRVWSQRLAARKRTMQLMDIAAAHFGLADYDLTGRRGPAPLARKRQITMYLAREIANASYPDLGRCFRRDHTTIIYACRVVELRMSWDREFLAEVANAKDAMLRDALDRLAA